MVGILLPAGVVTPQRNPRSGERAPAEGALRCGHGLPHSPTRGSGQGLETYGRLTVRRHSPSE